MSSLRWWCAALLAVVVVIQKVRGHGRLWEPPGRSTMWRSGFPTSPNYDDTGLDCGGRDHQWNVNGGMCGVCGDPWDKPPPRDNEDGGKYGTGIITRTYTPGQDIAVQLEITANHLGWFEFRICPQNDPKIPVTQECLDEYLLQLSDGSGTRFNLGPGMQIVEYNVRLPRDLTCSKCVVQWKWRTGNNYGGDQMHQEEFYACSDVAIGTPATTGPATNTPRPSVSAPPSFHPVTQTIRPPPGTPTAAEPHQTCRAKGLWAGNPTMDEWCTQTCVPSKVCDTQYCECTQVLVTHQVTGAPTHSPLTTTMQATSQTTLTSPTTVLLTPPPVTIHPASLPVTISGLHCYAVGSWAGNEDLDRWCQQACTTSLACDPQFCHCEERTVTQQSIHTTTHALMTNTPFQPLTTPTQTSTTSTTLKTVPTTTVPLRNQPQTHCFAIGTWAGSENLDAWCQQICTTSPSACDPRYCHCEERTVTQQSIHTTTHALMTNTPFQPLTTPTQTSTTSTTLKTVPTTTVPLSSQPHTHCFAIGAWAGSENYDAWCQQICTTSPSACDPQYCHCEEWTVTQQSIHTTTHALTTNTPFQPLTNPTQTSTASTTLNTVPTTTVLPGGVSQTHCFAVGAWAGKENLDAWCEQTCTRFACDPQYCHCEQSPHTQQVTNPTYQAQTVTLVPTTRQPPPPTQSVVQTLSTSTSSPTTTTVQLTTPATESPRQQCRAVGSWEGITNLDIWCTEACAKVGCDEAYCSCH